MEGLRFQVDEFSGQPRVIVPFQKTEACMNFASVAKEFGLPPIYRTAR